MPISHAVWTVSNSPVAVPQGLLPSEQMLEDMIVAQPRILSGEWMLIGRQIDTGYGGRIDLLAIAPDGSLVVVELKRDRTPREVVAQALDYAAWVQGLEAEDMGASTTSFAQARTLPLISWSNSVNRSMRKQSTKAIRLSSSLQSWTLAANGS